MAYISFQPSDYFSPLIYTGTGSAHAITGVGFQPDLVFTKERGSENWGCIDAVRGVTEALYPNLTTAETTDAQSITAFGSDGFSVGTSTTWNTSGPMACWNWKAGTTTGIDTTGSTITPSSYSFNATSGFSIIKYTGNGTAGALVPHGLGVAPGMIIVKSLSSDEWIVYTRPSGATKYQALNSTMGTSTSTSAWNDTEPTSVLFSLGTGADVNYNTEVYVAYCFADVKGYLKIGSYTANSNANGPYIYTGFRPALVICKRTDVAKNWYVWDSKRVGYNPVNNELAINTTAAEDVISRLDIVSNGFKLRSSSPSVNVGDFIYMAFAEFPTVSSNDIPTVAR